MTLYEALSLIGAAIAIVVSVISYLKSNALAAGTIELQINERITNTKEKVEDVSLLMGPLISKKSRTLDEQALLDNYGATFRARVEGNLNAYEEACSKYIDNKVDKSRFRKTYRTEIRQLVETPDLKDRLDPLRTRYKAIIKVYEEWENLEK